VPVAEVQQTVTERVATIEAHRAVINQAIGIIMWTYGIAAARAFDILTWRSQGTNTKIRTLAAHFLNGITAGLPPGKGPRHSGSPAADRPSPICQLLNPTIPSESRSDRTVRRRPAGGNRSAVTSIRAFAAFVGADDTSNPDA
jgi:hypothetical protein